MTGSWLCRAGDGNMKLKPSVTPSRIAAVRLANLKKLFPMLRGEMKSSVSIMPTPSWENRKKKVEEIIRYRYTRRPHFSRVRGGPRRRDRSAHRTSIVPCAFLSVYGFPRYCCRTEAGCHPGPGGPGLRLLPATCRMTDNK